MNKKYMNEALRMAKKAYKKGEIPVGCVIVKNNKIIAKTYNKKETKKSPVYHAEILAINKACRKNKNWRLNECTLYTTLEPCSMCYSAIIQSRINKIVYGTQNKENEIIDKEKLKKYKIEIIPDVLKQECELLIKNFFKNKRI